MQLNETVSEAASDRRELEVAQGEARLAAAKAAVRKKRDDLVEVLDGMQDALARFALRDAILAERAAIAALEREIRAVELTEAAEDVLTVFQD